VSTMKAREQVSKNEQTAIVKTNSSLFHKKKNELKVFSKNLPKEQELPTVPTSGGLFGLFAYNVKGSDFNRLTECIQDKMIEQNKFLVRTIQEFQTIYDTFSALDQEYIQGILISLKAAEKANEKALKGIEGVQANQHEIRQIISQQKQVIQVLKNFKERLEKIEHLGDVDQLFADFSEMEMNINEIESKIAVHERTIQDRIQSLAAEVAIYKRDFEDAIKELNVGIEKRAVAMSAQFESELSKVGSEIAELRQLAGSLSKVLKTTRIISFFSIAIACALVIFAVIGGLS